MSVVACGVAHFNELALFPSWISAKMGNRTAFSGIPSRQWLNSAGTGQNGVPQPVSGVPPPEIAVPPPKVVAPPPSDALMVHTVFLVS